MQNDNANGKIWHAVSALLHYSLHLVEHFDFQTLLYCEQYYKQVNSEKMQIYRENKGFFVVAKHMFFS